MNFVRTIPVVIATLGAFAQGCATAEPPHFEDEARGIAPVPACVVSLAPRPLAPGTVRNLSEDEVWHAVFPRYDAGAHKLPVDATACTGERIFDNPVFAGGTPIATPIEVHEGDIVYGAAGDRMRIVWLPTHQWPDGSKAGPLAIVRAFEQSAEVYAIGPYKRSTTKPAFQMERLGSELLVSATDDGCEGHPKSDACTSSVTFFLSRFGRLGHLQTVTTQKRAYAVGNEPGVSGQLEYVLTASPEFTADGVKVYEQVLTSDSAGRVLHKTELERTFVLHDAALEGGPDSLWARVYPSHADAKASPETPAAPAPSAPRANKPR